MNVRALLLGLLVLPLAAQTFSRKVLPSRPGPQRLEVDLALLGATRAGLADLSLRDAGGREIPYVLVPPDPRGAQWMNARVLPLPATKTTSGVELELGAPVRTSRVRLEGIRAPFLKRFSLEGSGDRQRWTQLVEAGSLFDLPEDGMRLLDVDFPEGDYRYLRITWDDRSSAPVQQPRAAALLKAGSSPVPPAVEIPFMRGTCEPGVSRFSIYLPGPRVPVHALLLSVRGDGPLLRDAHVTESRLAAGSLAPRLLGSARLRRTQREGASAYDLRIPVESPQGLTLDLKVDDGDNPGLDLIGVKAELDPQPWIYFEARDTEPLTATCGDPKAIAPKYDLEAVREHLAASVARASWGSLATLPPPPPLRMDGGTGAPLDAGGFRHKRPLQPGQPGLMALTLDAHVLAASPHLQDLRLLDESGRQIPYVLESREEPLALDLDWHPGTTKNHTTTYHVNLPQAGLPASRLVLGTTSRVFRRRVKVLAGDPPEVCSMAEWVHADPSQAPPGLTLSLPAQAGSEVTVEVEEGDNQALPITTARLLLPTWRMRYFRPVGAYALYYGRDLPAPDYDIALLADRLREAPAEEFALLGITAPTLDAPGRSSTRIFWGVLIVAVAGLLFLLYRLLDKDSQDPVAH